MIEIEEIKKMIIKAGDIVILRINFEATDFQMEITRKQLGSILPSQTKVIVLDSRSNIGIMEPGLEKADFIFTEGAVRGGEIMPESTFDEKI